MQPHPSNQAEPIDLPLKVRTALPGATLRQVFARMRALGHEPHPYGQEGDQRLCEVIAGATAGVPFEDVVKRWVDRSKASIVAAAPDLLGIMPAVTPQAPELGINKGKYRAFGENDAVDDCDDRDELACQYGWYYQAVQDVAAAGSSVIRQFDNCDLVWRWMFDRYFDDFPIPPPAEIYRMLTEDRLTYLFRFNLMLLACMVHGTRIVPTLFTLGGGSNLNDGDLGGNPKSDGGNGSLTQDKIDEIETGTPYHSGYVIPSAWGWSPFYYDEDEIGETETTDELLTFQQYCLYVRSQGGDDPYQIEAARRKSLALAAFGLAIGEHLALWDTVLAGFCVSITDVVPFLELGNEMSVHWFVSIDADGSKTDSHSTDEELYYAGAQELGQMMAMLAGPAWSRCSKLRFSVPGVASWGDPLESKWADRVEWIRGAITDGISNARAFWGLVRSREAYSMLPKALRDKEYRVFDETYPEVLDWLSTCEAADFCVWPPPLGQPLPDHSNLLQHVAFHWFHADDSRGSPGAPTAVDGGYAGEDRLLRDIAVFTEKLLSNPVDNGTLTLSWALHPAGFPAAKPSTSSNGDAEFSSLGDPMVQAGMLWRLLLIGKVSGAEIVSWHTHIAPIQMRLDGSNWNRYTSMGLRQDLSDGDPSVFRAASHAFRRPSWFALRRLAGFLSLTTATRLWSADDALYVVRLESSAGFSVPSDSSLPHVGLTTRYRYAYIAWLVQDAESDAGTVRLGDFAGGGYRRVSLAPVVDTSMATGVGDAGYAGGESIDWEWTRGSADWKSVADIVTARTSIKLTVYRASLDSRPVPVCVLTNATLTGAGVTVDGGAPLTPSGAFTFAGRRTGMVAQSGAETSVWTSRNPAAAWLSKPGGTS